MGLKQYVGGFLLQHPTNIGAVTKCGGCSPRYQGDDSELDKVLVGNKKSRHNEARGV